MKDNKISNKKTLNKEIILFLIFGILTTLLNWGCFYVLTRYMLVEENISNIISIIIAMIFAYFTNRKMVFNSQAKGRKEILNEAYKFFVGRGIAMLVEIFGFMLLFNIFHWSDFFSKGVITIMVVILTYIFSKFFAFKQK